jgi:hypothetical protein
MSKERRKMKKVKAREKRVKEKLRLQREQMLRERKIEKLMKEFDEELGESDV